MFANIVIVTTIQILASLDLCCFIKCWREVWSIRMKSSEMNRDRCVGRVISGAAAISRPD